MILRQRDWAFYPNAIIDDTTNNQSFLKFSLVLKELGVKHYYLTLALHNPTLKGINPHSPDLTPQQKSDIVAECYVNPWYYFRECLRVNGEDYFEISRGNFAMIWCFFNSIDAAVEFLRQHGKTTAIVGLESWIIRFTKKTRTIHVTRGPDLRAETIDKLKVLRDSLPDYLWPKSSEDSDNQIGFDSVLTGSKLICAIGQNNEASANGVGRGLTASRLFGDEGPFTKNIQHMLPAALASASTERIRHERKGIPYGNVFATTAGDLATAEGAYMYGLFTSGISWDELYLDVPTRKELLALIRKQTNSANPRDLFYIKFNHRQLGTTDEALIGMIRNAGGTREKILKDFGGVWATGGLNKPYTERDAIRMAESRTSPKFKEIFSDGYVVNWFYSESELARKMEAVHIIAVDPSDAVGRDAIGFVIVNSETGEIAGVCKIKESNIATFTSWMAKFMLKYKNTVTIVERRSQGTSILDGLLLLLDSEPNLHRRIYNKATQDDNTSQTFKTYVRGPQGSRLYWPQYRKTTGFATDGDKRKMLYSQVFSAAMNLTSHLIRSGDLIDEISGLVERNQRIDHVKSGHDDLVISWLMAMWLILLAKNVSVYGINNKKIHYLADVDGGENVQEIQELTEKIDKEKQEIENLAALISKTRCPVEKRKLVARMRYMLDNLEQVEEKAVTLDSLRQKNRARAVTTWL